MILCFYGCNQEAVHVLTNGKVCCSPKYQKCPNLRKKNSDGLEVAHKIGKYDLRNEGHRNNMLFYAEGSHKQHMKSLLSTDWDLLSLGRKKRRVKVEQGFACFRCGLKEWLGNPITLEVDHIDGNGENNVRDNLRALCPNCHSYTPTWRRKINSRLV